MSKLPPEHKFIDLSDYGRLPAKAIANSLKSTTITPIQVTTWFIFCGLLATSFILLEQYVFAAFLLVLKSVLDAADGELSRVKNQPSYTGRYYDSIADMLLNLLFLSAIWYMTEFSWIYLALAFVSIQLQGTLYNYYYVILRNSVQGDQTSRVFEDASPTAFAGEDQKTVDIFYSIYDFLYISFDKTIYFLDRKARLSKPFPAWFMTILSTFGLGFQLLVMAFLLASGFIQLVLPFFIGYSFFILVFVAIRRLFL